VWNAERMSTDTRISDGCPQPTTPAKDAPKKSASDRVEVYVVLDSVPAGKVSLDHRVGIAGGLNLTGVDGAIGSLFATVNITKMGEGGHEESRFVVKAEDVTLRVINWDIDGDTRYENNPHLIYLSTEGKPTGQLRIEGHIPGKGPFLLDTNGRVQLGTGPGEGFQVKWYKEYARVVSGSAMTVREYSKMETEVAGCLKRLDGSYLTAEVPHWMGGIADWWTARWTLREQDC
jgi:hypothetical protein